MISTTYQHDFITPHTKRYNFVKPKEHKGNERGDCQCVNENKVPATMAATQSNMEWTGVAPMGRLIHPRVIPTKFSSDQLDAMLNENEHDCYKNQPNRFLKILQSAYPDLYERLKQIPKDELNRRLDRDRMFTTYQIDFCDINEFPEGIYKSLETDDETSKLNASKLLLRKEPCAELKKTVMHEYEINSHGDNDVKDDLVKKSYKTFGISFADSSRFINSGNNSHWCSNIFSKQAKFSEYMDTINKMGCVIMKNKIHDHQKCNKGNCRHQLSRACTNLK